MANPVAPTRCPLAYALTDVPQDTREWQIFLKDDLSDLQQARHELQADAINSPAWALLSELIRRRSIQLDSAVLDNQIVQYIDDIPDKQSLAIYVGTVGQLDDTYRLPETSRPPVEPAKAVELLNKLPFVSINDVPQSPETWRYPSMLIKGPLSIPLERIVSAESFASWAGRAGNGQGVPDGKGGKRFTPYHFHTIEQTSRGAIVDYAQNDVSFFKNRYDLPIIDIVSDAEGEYWSFATTDGMHRLAAAKLRGALTSTIGSVRITSLTDMPQLSFSVRERFASVSVRASSDESLVAL